MKIEFTRAEIEAIILAHIKDEIAPYAKFVRNPGNSWGLPDTVTVETENAAQ
jgi:hypothetical protein